MKVFIRRPGLCYGLVYPFSPRQQHCVYPPQARQLSPAKSATDEGLVPSGETGEDLVALNLIEDGGQVRAAAPIKPSFCIPLASISIPNLSNPI